MQKESSQTTINIPKWPFYLASLTLAAIGMSIWQVAYRWDKPFFPSWQLIVIVSFMCVSSALIFVWPSIIMARLQVMADLPGTVKEFTSALADADTAAKSFGKARIAVEALREGVQEEAKMMEAMRDEFIHYIGSLKEKDHELQSIRLEYESSQKQINAWEDVAVDYLDYLQRLLEQDSVGESETAVIKRAADIFSRFISSRSLERIMPLEGDPFMFEMHQAVGEQHNDTVEPGFVLKCEEWGYRSGTVIKKKAKVILARNGDNQYIESRVSEADRKTDLLDSLS